MGVAGGWHCAVPPAKNDAELVGNLTKKRSSQSTEPLQAVIPKTTGTTSPDGKTFPHLPNTPISSLYPNIDTIFPQMAAD